MPIKPLDLSKIHYLDYSDVGSAGLEALKDLVAQFESLAGEIEEYGLALGEDDEMALANAKAIIKFSEME